MGKYGGSQRPFFLNNVRCSGNENSLFDCSADRYPAYQTQKCVSYEAVGIICTSNDTGNFIWGKDRQFLHAYSQELALMSIYMFIMF